MRDVITGNRVVSPGAICDTAAMIAKTNARKDIHLVPSADIAARVDGVNWAQIESELDAQG